MTLDKDMLKARLAAMKTSELIVALAVGALYGDRVLEPGTLDPDGIHTPGIFVHRIIRGASYSRLIEKLTVRSREEGSHAVVP